MSVRFLASLNLKLLTLMVLVFAFGSVSVFAQCRHPACDQKGERYDAKDHECRSGPDLITRAESHHPPTCPDGERLDLATGQCVLSACDEGCEVRELCRAKESYSRSGHDREGTYGVCESSSGTYRSHRLVHCPEGFTLNERRGVCVRCPTTVPVLFPDLVIRRAYLRLESSPTEVRSIAVGRSYLACFEVANAGRGPSGAFRVGGGGLGVPTSPFQNHASLLPGESRDGCLTYPTTPPAGTYRLQLTADSLRRVRELREDNNNWTIVVNITPR